MLLGRFRAILVLQHFSRTCTRSLICGCSRVPYFLNFRARSHPILFIGPNDVLVRFRVILRLQHFLRAQSRFLICLSPGRTPFWIFAGDCFQFYLFGLMILLMRFRTILTLQYFSCAPSRSLICHCSWEHFFLNFRTWSFAILFIRPIESTRAILRNFETPTFFARFNLPLLPGALIFEFLRAIASNIIYLA